MKIGLVSRMNFVESKRINEIGIRYCKVISHIKGGGTIEIHRTRPGPAEGAQQAPEKVIRSSFSCTDTLHSISMCEHIFAFLLFFLSLFISFNRLQYPNYLLPCCEQKDIDLSNTNE